MKNIVTVGGGTGSYVVLSGLKNIEWIKITALVSMADDGGSTGVLRDELGVLPPGDIRQCLVSLSEHSDIVRKLMGYRFSKGTFSGHSFGNIFLASLEKVTGDFVKGVEVASEILKVKGRVVPVTSDKAELLIELLNGKILKGENKINHSNIQDIGVKRIFYKNDVSLNESAKNSIIEADVIILGPGNYYCSLIPNLIVKGFKEAIEKSKALTILPINLTNKQGHTMYWKTSDYVKDIEKYLGKKVNKIIVNKDKPSAAQIKFYKLQEGDGVLVENDIKDKRIIHENILSHIIIKKTKGDNLHGLRSFIRHDGEKLANCIARTISHK